MTPSKQTDESVPSSEKNESPQVSVSETSTAASPLDQEIEKPKTLADVYGPSVSKFSVMSEKEMQEEMNKVHKFWHTQPVPRLNTDLTDIGPLDRIRTVDEVQKTGYRLPDEFNWVELDLTVPSVLDEVHELLANNYVEDDDALFRFNYSKEFFQWCLMPPGYYLDWIIGVKFHDRLVAFITGIPVNVFVFDRVVQMAEINFLCVHKSLRHRRLAPVLIREITRRVNLRNVWQAVYTAGVLLPRPVAKTRYYHRSINILKLVDVGFSRMPLRQTRAMAHRIAKLPDAHFIPGFRELVESDIPTVCKLLADNQKSNNRLLYIEMDEDAVRHWLLPRPDVLFSYVIEDPETKEVTDFVSFYNLPSRVIQKNTAHTEIKAAYAFYTVASKVPIKDLMQEGLIAASMQGFDVYNALDLGNFGSVLKDLKFGLGDGHLRYYLFNFACPEMRPCDVGMIMH